MTHGLQHTRLLCPPLSPRICSKSCSLSRWCFLTISSSVSPFSFCLQSFPASGGLFQRVSSSHQVAKVLEPSNSPCNEYSGLISFRIDWLHLLLLSCLYLPLLVSKCAFCFCISEPLPPMPLHQECTHHLAIFAFWMALVTSHASQMSSSLSL